MTTTVSVDTTKTPNVVTVVTDLATAAVVVGSDTTPFVRNPIIFNGVTAKPLTNDMGIPKTTATFSI